MDKNRALKFINGTFEKFAKFAKQGESFEGGKIYLESGNLNQKEYCGYFLKKNNLQVGSFVDGKLNNNGYEIEKDKFIVIYKTDENKNLHKTIIQIFSNGIFHFNGESDFEDYKGNKYYGKFTTANLKVMDEKYFSPFVPFVLGDDEKLKIVCANRNVFVGTLCEGNFGKGLLKYADGSSYEGEFKHGMKEGEGLVTLKSGLTYKAKFSYDKETQRGEIVTKNNVNYTGEYKDYLYHGKGKLELSDEEVFEGEFNHGVFEGKGTHYYKTSDGTMASESGIFKNGILVEKDLEK